MRTLIRLGHTSGDGDRRLMRRFGWVAFGFVVVLALVWAPAALHFTGPRPALLANGLPGALVLVGLGVLVAVPDRSAGPLTALVVLFAVFALWWSRVEPRNDLTWQPDVALHGARRPRRRANDRPEPPQFRLPERDRLHGALGDPHLRSRQALGRGSLHVVLGRARDRAHDHELGFRRRPTSRRVHRDPEGEGRGLLPRSRGSSSSSRSTMWSPTSAT